MSRLLLFLLLLAPAALAQDGAVSSVETDQAEYAYGETIELRYSISNEGDAPFTLTSPSPNCVVGFSFGALTSPGNAGTCFAHETEVEFPARSTTTWVWQLVPSRHGVPDSSGAQTITAYFDSSRLPATTTLNAPQYLGGRLFLALADNVELEDVQDIADALNAVVIEEASVPEVGGYVWEIEGTALADAIDAFGEDDRLDALTIYQIVAFTDVFQTDGEPGAPPLAAALTTAHPNPFTASTSFALTVPVSGPARVEAFDLLGRRVAILHDGPLSAGAEHHFTFRAADLPSGLYVVRATGDGFTETRRVTLNR